MKNKEIILSKVADTLIRQCDLFNCSYEEGWAHYMHPFFAGNISFDDVMDYIYRQEGLEQAY